MWSATDIFLVVASICAVALTLVVATAMGILIAAIGEIRALVRRLSSELDRIARARETIVRRGRFATSFAQILAGRIVARAWRRLRSS